ncbi:MAG: type II toxin-antitoxin system RelE/ParE family toxin [Microcystis aeruginosa L111-01]|jgi:addiction module RelE/StbE family toxin|uniref:type II toxin-antitoxin system RelE/ParE family toxin n=1 Tax=unclassified Microcystis TaxID=2643300 RepID=UPI001D25C67E|nr:MULTISPECIES: type II toxin-antitoxin system RelE/ParE family toxin [unclassified Microcystis]NCR11922.1 type II toxin-antitoxin system RelE/ParE family toxin [Microcystis aeruginosa SX13-11]NCR18433.1 type II toxin-antitoxin system RelE/ParE family toxin [Microcystis aeruginosa LL13-03]NCR21849.1 type II toxin-antitoxin system RelE/ParE family toxin [Microcystis aeruginosa L111-01]NCR65735.1 type II toxin-antitoxin system RelE/ParE family toxin [Microcystis aeruginosa LL11-07]NCR88083.1 ty
MKVFWTETAVNHLSSIYNYISQNSPQYAQRLVERLTRRSEQIANFPFSGRIVPEFETEQLREVIEGSYRIIYYIKPEQIDVIAVLHAARNIENPQD